MSDGPAADRRFGECVRRLRRERGISQRVLAGRARIHPAYLSQLERGLRSPSLGVIAALADGLGIQPWELVRAAEGDESADGMTGPSCQRADARPDGG